MFLFLSLWHHITIVLWSYDCLAICPEEMAENTTWTNFIQKINRKLLLMVTVTIKYIKVQRIFNTVLSPHPTTSFPDQVAQATRQNCETGFKSYVFDKPDLHWSTQTYLQTTYTAAVLAHTFYLRTWTLKRAKNINTWNDTHFVCVKLINLKSSLKNNSVKIATPVHKSRDMTTVSNYIIHSIQLQ